MFISPPDVMGIFFRVVRGTFYEKEITEISNFSVLIFYPRDFSLQSFLLYGFPYFRCEINDRDRW